MIEVLLNGNYKLHYDSFVFSGGEVHIKLNTEVVFHQISFANIFVRLESSESVMKLMMVVDALRQSYGNITINLFMPYLPYARQDRLCDNGEAFSLKVFCNLINSLQLNKVVIVDCHSDVGVALLNNVSHLSAAYAFRAYIPKDAVILAPDAGAVKRCTKIAQAVSFDTKVVCALKERDPKTGKLTKVFLPAESRAALEGKNVWICDDIVDGGATFINLADAIDFPVYSLNLAVTHGIFSKGFEMCKKFDKVVTTNSIRELAEVPNNVTVIDIFQEIVQ